jgi:RNA polymerase sigma-70 factor (ECF subfamily)
MQTVTSTINLSLQVPALGNPCSEPLDWVQQAIISSQRGSLDAFNQLVLAFQDSIYHFADWILNDEEAAADATQEVFLRAYRNLNTLRGGSFRAWLFKVTKNVCLDQIRSTSRHPQISLVQMDPEGETPPPQWLKDPRETPEQSAERVEDQNRITGEIRRLAPIYRSVLILIDVNELDYAEASSVLRIPIGTVKSRLTRARCQLRSALQSTAG